MKILYRMFRHTILVTQNFSPVIKSNLSILYQDKKLKDLMKKLQIIKSKRQQPNLKRILTRAKFDNMEQKHTVKKCKHPNCGLCKHLIEAETFYFLSGKTFKVNQSMSCDVKNVIYVIQCNNCNLEYIGETSNLRNRVTVYNQQIRDKNLRHLKVSEHLAMCAEHMDSKYHIFPFYRVLENRTTLKRKLKERTFIDMFKRALNSV